MRRSRAQWLVRAACVAIMVFAVTGCGPNPQLDFIQARPENALAYPGATLLSTKTYPEDSLLGGGASIEREFTSGASTDDIVAWYRTELSSRNWSGGVVAGDRGNGYASSNERRTSTDPPAGTVTVVPKLASIEEALGELAPRLAGDPNGEAPPTLQPARLAATNTTPTVLPMALRLH